MAFDLKLYFQLLSGTTTLHNVQDFLKDSGQKAKTAGSWDDAREKRIEPYLKSKDLKEAALTEFIDEIEDFGLRHVFLYKATNPAAVWKLAHAHAAKSVDWHWTPEKLSLGAVRVNGSVVEACAVQAVDTEEVAQTSVQLTDGLVRRVTTSKRKYVDVARVHRTGLVELTIASRNGISAYHKELKPRLELWKDVVRLRDLQPVDVRKARDHCYDHMKRMTKEIRFGRTKEATSQGTVFDIAVSDDAMDLSKDPSVKGAVDLIQKSGGRRLGGSMSVLPPDPDEGREISVVFRGEPNEYAIMTKACARTEYERARELILQHC